MNRELKIISTGELSREADIRVRLVMQTIADLFEKSHNDCLPHPWLKFDSDLTHNLAHSFRELSIKDGKVGPIELVLEEVLKDVLVSIKSGYSFPKVDEPLIVGAVQTLIDINPEEGNKIKEQLIHEMRAEGQKP
jgi:hypothetical protein